MLQLAVSFHSLLDIGSAPSRAIWKARIPKLSHILVGQQNGDTRNHDL